MTSWKNLSNPLKTTRAKKQAQQVYGDNMITQKSIIFLYTSIE